MNFIKAFRNSFTSLRKDKLLILIYFIPMISSLIIYYLLGQFLYNKFFTKFIDYLSNDYVSDYIIWFILGTIFYFFISITIFQLITFLCFPINDLVCGRVQKKLNNINTNIKLEIDSIFKRFYFIFKNELKKFCFISILVIISILINFIPILSPISFFLASLLFSINFLDYSWSQNNLTLRECLRDLRKNIFSYFVSGTICIFFISIPFLNILVFPFFIIYFTNLYHLNNSTEK